MRIVFIDSINYPWRIIRYGICPTSVSWCRPKVKKKNSERIAHLLRNTNNLVYIFESNVSKVILSTAWPRAQKEGARKTDGKINLGTAGSRVNGNRVYHKHVFPRSPKVSRWRRDRDDSKENDSSTIEKVWRWDRDDSNSRMGSTNWSQRVKRIYSSTMASRVTLLRYEHSCSTFIIQ